MSIFQQIMFMRIKSRHNLIFLVQLLHAPRNLGPSLVLDTGTNLANALYSAQGSRQICLNTRHFTMKEKDLLVSIFLLLYQFLLLSNKLLHYQKQLGHKEGQGTGLDKQDEATKTPSHGFPALTHSEQRDDFPSGPKTHSFLRLKHRVQGISAGTPKRSTPAARIFRSRVISRLGRF
jgi:hypothetical protein